MICPACRNPLTIESDGMNRFVAYCAVGRCPSYLANDGAIGDTPEGAAAALLKKLKAEQDWDLE